MKRLFTVLAILLSIMSVVNAQTKQDKKLAKSRAKELTKQGWQAQTSKGVEAGFLELFSTMNSGDYAEYVADGASDKSLSAAKAKSRNNAINEYVEYSKSIVKSRIVTELNDLKEEEAENYISNFERLIVKNLEDDVFRSPVLVLYKQEGRHYDVRSYYLIDNSAAERVVRNAMQKAAEESDLAHKHADGISKFINSGLEELAKFGEDE